PSIKPATSWRSARPRSTYSVRIRLEETALATAWRPSTLCPNPARPIGLVLDGDADRGQTVTDRVCGLEVAVFSSGGACFQQSVQGLGDVTPWCDVEVAGDGLHLFPIQTGVVTRRFDGDAEHLD